MRQRYCKVCGDWHDLDLPWPNACRVERNASVSDLPRPMLIRDGLDEVWNPVDGKRYTSKAAYYRAVKAAGCEIAGNDSSIATAHTKPREIKKMGGVGEDLRRAWDQAS